MSLRWIESAGLHVQPPTREGFGTRMLKALIRGQLNGDLHFDWRPEGLACEMTIPLAEGKEQTEAHSFLS